MGEWGYYGKLYCPVLNVNHLNLLSSSCKCINRSITVREQQLFKWVVGWMVVAWGTGEEGGGGCHFSIFCFCSFLWKCVYLPVSVGHNGSEVKNKQTKHKNTITCMLQTLTQVYFAFPVHISVLIFMLLLILLKFCLLLVLVLTQPCVIRFGRWCLVVT